MGDFLLGAASVMLWVELLSVAVLDTKQTERAVKGWFLLVTRPRMPGPSKGHWGCLLPAVGFCRTSGPWRYRRWIIGLPLSPAAALWGLQGCTAALHLGEREGKRSSFLFPASLALSRSWNTLKRKCRGEGKKIGYK